MILFYALRTLVRWSRWWVWFVAIGIIWLNLMIFKAMFGMLVTGEESVDLRNSHCCRFQDFKLTLVCMAEENW